MVANSVETLQDLATFVAQSTALFPGLLAFSIGSRTSLKAWLAVRNAPPAPRVSKQDEKKMKRKMIAGFVLVLAIILGTEVYLFAQNDARSIDRFFTYLFAYVFQVSLVNLFVEISQATEWSVHRGAAGILHFRPRNVSKARAIVALASATALNVASYYGAHWACGSVCALAVIFSRLACPPARVFSLRGCMFYLLGVVAFLTVVSGIAITAAIKMDKDKTAAGGEPNVDEIEYVGFASAHVMQYMNPFVLGIYTMVQGVLIAGCFRFDHANALEASPETFAPLALEAVEAPATKCNILSSGLVVPTSVPNHFPKPFYSVALWSWLLAQLSTAGLLFLTLPLPKVILDNGVFSLLSFYLSSLFLIIGITVTAVCKGQAKKMWTYREVWVPKADKGITLADDEGLPAEEETLPAYEPAKVEPVVDAAKEPLLVETSNDNKA